MTNKTRTGPSFSRRKASTQSTNTPEFDVLVIGGGVVGSVLTVALERSGFQVGLVETKRPEPMAIDADYELRFSAISPGSQRLLANLGLWDQLPGTRIEPYYGMRVWEGNGPATLAFEHTAVGLPELGHIVENRVIIDAAWQALGRASVFAPASLSTMTVDTDGAHVQLEDGTTLTARLVIGAEGAGSPVRKLAGMQTAGWSYGQRCTVGNLVTEKPHQGIAWQRYIPSGPVAFLPLSDGRCSLAWHADNALAHELAELDEAAFCRRLTEASGGVLGTVQSIEHRASFPLQLMHATEYVGPRIAVIGDAAHVVHPMAGQGVNLGLMDIAVLMDVLNSAHTSGRDIGKARLLRRYQRRRKVDNLAMMGATDALKRVFGVDDTVASRARDRGIALADALMPLKQRMIREATGLTADAPTLMQP